MLYYLCKMDRKVYLCLLIVCGILFQEICTLSEENEKSEDPHIRKKRVIGSKQTAFENAPYAVPIYESGEYRCVGSLLSPDFAITAAHCFMFDPHEPKFSMMSSTLTQAFGIRHNITDIIRYPGFNSDKDVHDLSLFKFLPHINFMNSRNRPIKLYNGHLLPPNSYGTVTSWGCYAIRGGRKQWPKQLRSASMKIITLDECRRLYNPSPLDITYHYICTFDNGEKRCDDGDSGAPLVVNGELVGVMSWNYESRHLVPDVFMNILLPMYRSWIARFVPSALEYGSGS